jgi:hypothetical protein
MSLISERRVTDLCSGTSISAVQLRACSLSHRLVARTCTSVSVHSAALVHQRHILVAILLFYCTANSSTSADDCNIVLPVIVLENL